ncbi:NAD(+) diphosphatase [Achromobacter anxifer]|uniref:NAD(+) diphosphatase n=1 Tax=Achromobacter anxifer TaxID=1287737 RepID=A0A6S7CCF8_9BURK|nr:NAD(+) diphosphatase [Achromobacter anxifer]MDF8359728.1 NAD(+) diphosphatase [Achromobacter anxifer]CAB3830865.1 NADH pyrophosphatase [Achromobacter anxifer]CAB5513524.1 NADH pyrophosphatase [Achromobacter anxifer]
MNFVFRRDELLVEEESSVLPDTALCAQIGLAPAALQPIWTLPGSPYRTVHVEPGMDAPKGYAFKKLRSLFGVLDDESMALAGRAYQIAEWARTHKFCGVCGTPPERLQTEFCMRCPQCGFSAYPRISPAMMVLIRKGDSILLARHTTTATSRYTALAGFVEPGESIEQTIHREVHEEVGLKVGNLQYFGSQSWPFPHSLMVAFTADYVSGEIRVQEDEIADARWFGPGDAMPEIAPRISVAGWLIRANLPMGWSAP